MMWPIYLQIGDFVSPRQHIDCDDQYHFGRVFNDIPRANFFGEEFVNDNSAQFALPIMIVIGVWGISCSLSRG